MRALILSFDSMHWDSFANNTLEWDSSKIATKIMGFVHLGNEIWLITNLNLRGFVIGLMKQKSSLFVIRSLDKRFLQFLVFHC